MCAECPKYWADNRPSAEGEEDQENHDRKGWVQSSDSPGSQRKRLGMQTSLDTTLRETASDVEITHSKNSSYVYINSFSSLRMNYLCNNFYSVGIHVLPNSRVKIKRLMFIKHPFIYR